MVLQQTLTLANFLWFAPGACTGLKETLLSLRLSSHSMIVTNL